jgi:hypothetical protein
MKIKFSRHAKRRARLYGISKSVIESILLSMNLNQGNHEIIKKVVGFKYPIKILCDLDKEDFTVITCYPLKKGRKK